MSAVILLLALQSTQASISGAVSDEQSGHRLTGVLVELGDLNRIALTDSTGQYHLPNVPAGPHHLTLRLPGYRTRTLHALVPAAGRLEINIVLRPEPIPLRALEVRPVVPVRGMEAPTGAFAPDRAVSNAVVRHHPQLAEVDVLQALAGGVVTVEPEAAAGLYVRGGAADHTAYVIDGVPVFSPRHAAGMFAALNPDAIAETQLIATAPSPALPHALSGVVSALTRAPGPVFRSQGGISTTQARITVDGPVGRDAGVLVSLRTGFPGTLAPSNEASYLRSESEDGLAKLEAPLLGGRLHALLFDSETGISAAAAAEADTEPAPRHAFEWHSQSVGAEWRRAGSGYRLSVQGWFAAQDADALWRRETGRLDVAAKRRDLAFAVQLERRDSARASSAGARIEDIAAAYRVTSGEHALPGLSIRGHIPVTTAFATHTRQLAARLTGALSAAFVFTPTDRAWSPTAQLRWDALDRLSVTGSYSRQHQFAQSLRNPESIAGAIFPVDLFVAAGSTGVPVARSEQLVMAADFRPAAGLRLGMQAYTRIVSGVVLVAPTDGQPFGTRDFAVGSGRASGLSVEAAANGTRHGLLAGYGWQRVRYEHGSSTYAPDQGGSHTLDAALVVYPAATLALRASVTAALGRRASTIANALEWESCNLLDEGCEFAGSPYYDPQSASTARLPAYARVDIGLRKHWHIGLARRDGVIAAFGTLTNVFGRRNVLTYATGPLTAEHRIVEMLPFSILVIGLDWRF
jgi:hypothetical protein